MTGPQHYQRAEQLIKQANAITDGFPSAAYEQALLEAQVHATLALAAATAMNDFNPNGDGIPAPDWAAWKAAAATPAPPEGGAS
jgi:hypothetical protein